MAGKRTPTGMSFREIATQVANKKWKEITVPIGDGGSGSGYLLDQKVVDHAGGYGYKDSSRLADPARNRFIYWRTHQDVLELIETSLDYELSGSAVRFRFHGTALLGEVNIHESHGNIVILVCTTTSVHRLIFPHPKRLQTSESTYLHGAKKSIPSIFTDVSVVRVQDLGNCHNFNATGTSTAYQVHTATSWLSSDGEAIFALPTSTGSILLIKLPPYGLQGIATQHELKQSSMMQRIWTGFVPSVMRGGMDLSGTCTSLVLHPLSSDTFVFAVNRDHKIRMWSCKSYDCVMAADLLEYMPNNSDPTKLKPSNVGHIIKKSVASTAQALKLGIFLNFADRCQFCIVEPVFAEARYQLNHVTTVFGTQDDLLDFCLSETHLWALWNSSDDENCITCASIENDRPRIECERYIAIERSEPGELEVPIHLDPREYYLDQIFCPGHFSILAIIKALNIFKRSLESTNIAETSIPVQALRGEVMVAVEHEIQNSASDCNISEEEYQNLQLQQWAKFYSCCVQYQERQNKPLGVFADDDTKMVAVVRQGSTSFFRTCDNIEHLSLTPPEGCHIEDFDLYEDEAVFNDVAVFKDVIVLCDCAKYIRQSLTDDLAYSFEQDLYHTENPVAVADNLVAWLLADTELQSRQEALTNVSLQLGHVHNLEKAVQGLIELLDLVSKPQDDDGTEMDMDVSRQQGLSHLFSSPPGVSLLARGVQQLVQSRLDLSRDLLLLLTFATQRASECNLSVVDVNLIRSDLLGKACVLVRAFYLLKRCSEMLVAPATTNQIEANMQLLEALGLLETMGSVTSHNLNDHQSTILLELFLQGSGGRRVKEILSYNSLFDEDPCALWQRAFMPIVKATAQVLWPYNRGTVFPEFLISHCQYTSLQEYVHLTKDWCEYNRYTHRFFSGLSHFSCREARKAMECFLQVPLDFSSEDFFIHLVPEGEEGSDQKVLYFLRILGVYEQFHFPHLAMNIARNTISMSQATDPQLPTLWSKVFKNELEMGHNEDAYTAMLSNPDKDRRRDCLRQFLVVLCERSELHTLVSLPYRDRSVVLEEEVVSILESRARSIDLTKHNYYDLLYAFHVYRHNYRKAGSVMYEYGMRLGREVSGVKGLQKQAKCYLAALNALRLVSPEYAWIVKPLNSTSDLDQPRESPKRALGEEDCVHFSNKRQVLVLELEDMEKEYMLVHARLQLHHNTADLVTGGTSSPAETVGLLVSAGLFDAALNICKIFKLPYTPVFEGLASRCVNLAENSLPYMQGDNEYTSGAWKWLQHNDLATANATRESSSTDHAWRLLQEYLKIYEDGTTVYHKCVAVKFLSQGFTLPTWLTLSYKKSNAAELLRLYLDYDLLEEASHHIMEYVDAVLGKGKEFFGLTTSLHTGCSPVWLPYTSIDQLLSALSEVETEPLYQELHHKIRDKLNHYFEILEQVSEDTRQSQVAQSTLFERSMQQNYSMKMT